MPKNKTEQKPRAADIPAELRGLIQSIRRVPTVAAEILALDWSRAQVSVERIDDSGDVRTVIQPGLIGHVGIVSDRIREKGAGDYIVRFWPSDGAANSHDIPYTVRVAAPAAVDSVAAPAAVDFVDDDSEDRLERLERLAARQSETIDKLIALTAAQSAASAQPAKPSAYDGLMEKMLLASVQRQIQAVENPMQYLRAQIADATELLADVDELRDSVSAGREMIETTKEPNVIEKACGDLIRDHGASVIKRLAGGAGSGGGGAAGALANAVQRVSNAG